MGCGDGGVCPRERWAVSAPLKGKERASPSVITGSPHDRLSLGTHGRVVFVRRGPQCARAQRGRCPGQGAYHAECAGLAIRRRRRPRLISSLSAASPRPERMDSCVCNYWPPESASVLLGPEALPGENLEGGGGRVAVLGEQQNISQPLFMPPRVGQPPPRWLSSPCDETLRGDTVFK